MEFFDVPALGRVAGSVPLPGSKSISNRLLLLAALAEGTTEIRDLLDSVVDPGSGADRLGVTAEQKKTAAAQLRDLMTNALGNDASAQMIAKLSDDDTFVLGRKEMWGVHIATPVFDAASEKEIRELLKFADMDENGQVQLYDGRTGDPFAEKVTVGAVR